MKVQKRITLIYLVQLHLVLTVCMFHLATHAERTQIQQYLSSLKRLCSHLRVIGPRIPIGFVSEAFVYRLH